MVTFRLFVGRKDNLEKTTVSNLTSVNAGGWGVGGGFKESRVGYFEFEILHACMEVIFTNRSGKGQCFGRPYDKEK